MVSLCKARPLLDILASTQGFLPVNEHIIWPQIFENRFYSLSQGEFQSIGKNDVWIFSNIFAF